MAVWAPITGFWATLGWFFGQISFKHFSYNLFQTGLLRHSNCLSFLVRKTANLLPIKIILKRKKCYFEIVCQLWGLASNPSTIFCCCCCCVCREKIWQFFRITTDHGGLFRRIIIRQKLAEIFWLLFWRRRNKFWRHRGGWVAEDMKAPVEKNNWTHLGNTED